jgi:molybdopterin-guanine dinucleotide biosynthesis protein A
MPAGPPVTLVVLAGGRSRRFGADKLGADLGGVSLLDRCLADVPADWEVVVVGDERTLGRDATFVREHPPRSGPTAALVTGLRSATAPVVVTTPGDAPAGGRAATVLLAALLAGKADAVVGVDVEGVEQPLQLALRGGALRRLAALDDATVADQSARRLLLPLVAPTPVPLAPALTFDVDTPEHAAAYADPSGAAG